MSEVYEIEGHCYLSLFACNPVRVLIKTSFFYYRLFSVRPRLCGLIPAPENEA